MTDKQEGYRQLLDDINDGFLIIQEGKIVFANARWVEMVGYEHEDLPGLLGVPFTAFVHPKEQAALWWMHKRPLRGEVVPEHYEFTLARVDGTSFPAEISAKVMEYLGQPAISVLVRDITERKRVEQALRHSEQHLRSLVENALGLILVVNAIATIRYVSPSSERIFGHRMEDLIGKNAFDFVHPEDMSHAINVFTQEVQIPGYTVFLELRLRHKDGSWRVVELTGKNLLDDPAVAGVVLNYRDITERKQAEERIQRFNLTLRAIHNVNQLITREKDRNKLLQDLCANLMVTRGYYNAWIALLDESGGLVTTAEIGLGEDFLPMIERLKRGLLTNCGRKALKQPHVVTTQDPSSTCADCPLAEKYRGRAAMTIRLEYDGKVYGLLCVSIPADLAMDKKDQSLLSEVAMDIASALHAIELEEKRKRAEKKLEELYEEERNLRQELETEIKKRAEFNRALVHELKTPLTTIMAASDILIAHLQEEPPLRLARNIYKGAIDLNNRIDELFDLARGEIGMLELKPKPVDPLLLLRGVVNDMAPVASRKGQSLILDLSPFLPMVWADETRLRQVVLNLLSNACKFTPEGGKITLRAREGDATLVVEVQDTGVGIAEEEQQRLFEPYYRVADDRQQFKGLGLGLALCKMLVELHGGQIWVESHVGKGSTFSFSVPLETTSQQVKNHETGDRL